MVPTYRWCGLRIASDVDLSELPRSRDGISEEPHWTLDVGEGRAPRRAGRQWFHHWRFPDGRRWLSFARHADGHLLRFPGLADFDIVPGVRRIHAYRDTSTPLHTLKHLLLDQVLPLIVGDRDHLALHGSVVSIPASGGNGALAFLGPARHGKSTLAASLVKQGCAVVSDDCCLLERRDDRFVVVPSYPGVRLSPDSIVRLYGEHAGQFDPVSHYSTKRRISSQDVAFNEDPLPLCRLFTLAPLTELERAASIQIRMLTPREALLDLIAFTFHLDVRHTQRVKQAFELAADVAATHDVRRLTYPWNLAGTEALAAAVLKSATS
jgi:hypothetical protein